MSHLSIWTIIFGAGLVTYLMRLSFVVAVGRIPEPKNLTQILRLVPAAVLSALVISSLFVKSQHVSINITDGRLLAALLAAAVAWRTKNLFLTITCGMISLWIFRYLITLW